MDDKLPFLTDTAPAFLSDCFTVSASRDMKKHKVFGQRESERERKRDVFVNSWHAHALDIVSSAAPPTFSLRPDTAAGCLRCIQKLGELQTSCSQNNSALSKFKFKNASTHDHPPPRPIKLAQPFWANFAAGYILHPRLFKIDNIFQKLFDTKCFPMRRRFYSSR